MRWFHYNIDTVVRCFQGIVLIVGIYFLLDAARDATLLVMQQDARKYGALFNHFLVLSMLSLIYLLLGVWQRERIRLKATIEVIGDGFALFDQADRLIRCNTAFAQVYGATPKQLESCHLHKILTDGYQKGRGIDPHGQSCDLWLSRHGPTKDRPQHRTSEVGTWDGRCLLVTERMTDQGERVIVHTDITDQQQQKEELLRLATYDALTETLNRRSFMQQAAEMLRQSRLRQRPVALLMLDVDRFKAVNDTYGHAAGDEVLRTMAKGITTVLRKVDLVGRLGGEEFALLLPQTDYLEAQTVAERLRCQLKDLSFKGPKNTFHITVSIGLVMLDKRDQDLEMLIARADALLYQAKVMGRNRVCSGVEVTL